MDLTPFKECNAHKNAIFIGNDDAPFRPCCWFEGQIDATSYEDYQEKLSQLDIEKNCRYCIDIESNGGELSPRTHYNQSNGENFITASISFDNLCNLKCITCSPTNSSQLAIEIKDVKMKKKYTSIQKKEPLKTDFLKKMLSSANFNYNIFSRPENFDGLRIEILGGEPLINPAVYNFLDWLVEQPYAPITHVIISSNGTTYDDRIVKYIKRFRVFSIQLSIDGIENTFEYIRFGSKFSTFKDVADKFYELSHTYSHKFKLAFNYTLSWMNALHIKEFFNWIHANYPKVHHILVTKLEGPDKYAINVLPTELRKEIVKKVTEEITISDIKSVGVQIGLDYYKQHMLTTPQSTQSVSNIKSGIDTLAYNDKLINRNSDFNETFKPMLDLLKTNNYYMTTIEKATTSKTFCIYPWIHQYVGPDGEVKPCCIYKPNKSGLGNIKKNPLKEIWNNDLTKQMRLDMLNGVEISGCSMCNVRVGVTRVHRDDTNDLWFEKNKDTVNQTLDDGTLPEHKLKYIDARFNNLCNLKCRTCSPYFSTSWHEDHKKLRDPNTIDEYPKTLLIPGNTNSQLLEEIWPHLPEVEQIYFAGGEPLMQIEHYKVLEELIRINHTGTKSKPLTLQYSTNFTSLTLGKHNVLDYWKQFSRVVVNASLDGSYARAEYWRKGTDWDKVVQNRIDLKKTCPRVIFNIGFTLSWVNAFNLLDLHKEWVEKYYINFNSISVNILDYPSMYSLKYIPNWKKKKIEEAFLKHIEWLESFNRLPIIIAQVKERFTNAIKFMYDVDIGFDYSTEFKTTTEDLDKVRNENFWEVFLEHNDMKELIYGSNSLQKLPSTN